MNSDDFNLALLAAIQAIRIASGLIEQYNKGEITKEQFTRAWAAQTSNWSSAAAGWRTTPAPSTDG